MFILARQGQSYARLRFHVGPGGDLDLPVHVDYSRPFAGSDQAAWEEEYLAAVQVAYSLSLGRADSRQLASAAAAMDPWDDDWFLAWDRLFSDEEPGFVDAKESFHAI